MPSCPFSTERLSSSLGENSAQRVVVVICRFEPYDDNKLSSSKHQQKSARTRKRSTWDDGTEYNGYGPSKSLSLLECSTYMYTAYSMLHVLLAIVEQKTTTCWANGAASHPQPKMTRDRTTTTTHPNKNLHHNRRPPPPPHPRASLRAPPPPPNNSNNASNVSRPTSVRPCPRRSATNYRSWRLLR